ncbi:MAG: DUF559 domain-containing protein [Bacteroidetes bacterium]|nr:DUF559 domain-containing protein [Bacteroidota bacterium]
MKKHLNHFYSNSFYNPRLKDYSRALRKRMTKAEVCLWKYALRAGMMHGYTFNRQRPILKYIADFMCKALKLIIEADGITHLDEIVIKNDRNREEVLREFGFEILRFTDEEVLNNIASVKEVILNWITERVIDLKSSP